MVLSVIEFWTSSHHSEQMMECDCFQMVMMRERLRVNLVDGPGKDRDIQRMGPDLCSCYRTSSLSMIWKFLCYRELLLLIAAFGSSIELREQFSISVASVMCTEMVNPNQCQISRALAAAINQRVSTNRS